MAVSHLSILIIFIIIGHGDGWRAIPANEAQYAVRSSDIGRARGVSLPDDQLPRDFINSIYKFGDCERYAIKKQFLRTTINVSLDSFDDSQGDYLYVLADMVTQRFKKQCVVLKTYVPRKYLFWKSRMPLYYCQGQLYIMMMDTVHRLAIHEFYAKKKISIPATFYLEFYQPNVF